MTTARDIIKRALQQNGVLTKGESPSGDEADDALNTLNAMLSSWSNDSLLVYTKTSESFPLVGGQAVYTIGSGGDFDTARPLQILNAFTRIGSTDYDIGIINGSQYDEINQKDISTSFPEVLYYNQTTPLGTITLYPVPTTGTLHIRSEKQLTAFTTLDTDETFPPGWERALVFNLALELGAEYGQPPSQIIYEIAMDSLNKIKTATARNKNMDAYPQVHDDNNIFSGWYT